MNPEFRKVALIAAALGLIVSLYLALSAGDDQGAAALSGFATVWLRERRADREDDED